MTKLAENDASEPLDADAAEFTRYVAGRGGALGQDRTGPSTSRPRSDRLVPCLQRLKSRFVIAPARPGDPVTTVHQCGHSHESHRWVRRLLDARFRGHDTVERESAMTYVPHTERETREMLRRDRRRPHGGPVRRCPGGGALSALDLPPPSSEMEIMGRCRRSPGAISASTLPLVSRRRRLPSLPARGGRLRAAARRVLHLIYAVSAGSEPGHAAGPVRIPEHDLPAHRHGREQRQPL